MNQFKWSDPSFGLDDSTRNVICQGVPLLRRPTERHGKLKAPALQPVDPIKTTEPGELEQQLTSLKLVNRKSPVRKVRYLELLSPSAPPVGPSLSGLNASRVSLPPLGRLQPRRPLQPPNASTRRTACPRMPILKCPTKRDDKLKGQQFVDPIEREPEQKLTGLKLVNRGCPVGKVQHLEPLPPSPPPVRPSLSGLDASRVSLPPLGGLQPSRPLQPPNASTRRTACPRMPILKCPTKRDDKLTGQQFVDPTEREPEQKSTSLNLVIIGRSVKKVWSQTSRPCTPPNTPTLPRLDTHQGQTSHKRVSLPILDGLQPPRSLQPHPKSIMKRTKHLDKDLGLCVSNTPGFPRLAP